MKKKNEDMKQELIVENEFNSIYFGMDMYIKDIKGFIELLTEVLPIAEYLKQSLSDTFYEKNDDGSSLSCSIRKEKIDIISDKFGKTVVERMIAGLASLYEENLMH